MSVAFDRGRDTEREVASIIRKKLKIHVQRDKQSGAGINKADISDYYGELPLFIECKDQETIKVKEWMRQTIEGASFGQAPTLVFRMENELMACLPFNHLLNFLLELKELRADVNDLREPIELPHTNKEQGSEITRINKTSATLITQKIEHGAKTCRNGHISDDYGYCMQLNCKFSRGYKKPKEKKK